MSSTQGDGRTSRLACALGPVARCALVLAACGVFAAPARAQAPVAPRYSISIPSIDEIPLDAIPPAPAPVKRTPPKPAPVAKSPEEQAAYDMIGKETKPDDRIRLVEDFLLAYPDSQFRQAVYLAAADAYRRRNDLPRMLTYAELTLAEDPENLQALLTLAEALPESVNRDDPDYTDRVDEAAEYARKSLELVSKMARPLNSTPEQWQRTRRQVESAARLALALTAMMSEDYPAAEAEYDAAFKLMEQPDALSLYRLGLTYSLQKKYDDAIAALQRSVEAGGVRGRSAGGAPRELAAEALAYVEKEKAAAAPKPVVESSSSTEDAKGTEAGKENASGETPSQ